eukprot:TCALIF_03355-PA protein Name:"Protein of unknown function" AED:0.63 eAED:0.63 QI:146/1/0.5/1/0/0.5/2/0/76
MIKGGSGSVYRFRRVIEFRTAINVLGDSIGAGLVYELSKAELELFNQGKIEGGFEAVPMNEIDEDNATTTKDRNNK